MSDTLNTTTALNETESTIKVEESVQYKMLEKSINSFISKTVDFVKDMKSKEVSKEVIQAVINNYIINNLLNPFDIKIEGVKEQEIPEGQEFVNLEFKKIGASLKKVMSMVFRETGKLSEDNQKVFMGQVTALIQEKFAETSKQLEEIEKKEKVKDVSEKKPEVKVQKDTVEPTTVEEDDEDKIKKEIESLELRLKKIQESKVKPQPVKRFTTSGIRMINSLEELMALA